MKLLEDWLAEWFDVIPISNNSVFYVCTLQLMELHYCTLSVSMLQSLKTAPVNPSEGGMTSVCLFKNDRKTD